MDPTDWNSLSLEARYGRYCFQRESLLLRLEKICTSRAGPSVVFLEGVPGSGRGYALDAVSFRLEKSGVKIKVLTMDVEGFEPDLERNIEIFVESHLTRMREIDDSWRRELITLGRALAGLAGDWTSVAATLSTSLKLEDPIRTLKRLVDKNETIGNNSLLPKEILGDFLQSVSENRHTLILHVEKGDSLTETLLRWLVDCAQSISNLILTISCRDDHLEVSTVGKCQRLCFEPLSPSEVAVLIDDRFSPNRFPSFVAKSLHDATQGLQSVVMAKVHKLVSRGYFMSDRDGTWLVAGEAEDEYLANAFKFDLWEPISRWLEESEAVWVKEFLTMAALCGDRVPAEVVFKAMDLDTLELEALEDLLDDEISGEGIYALFDEPQLDSPSYPGVRWVYRFKNPMLPTILLLQSPEWELQRDAQQLLSTAEAILQPQTRAIVGLFLNLAERIGVSTAERYRRRLSWWVGHGEAEALQEGLAEALRTCRIADAESLWKAVQETSGIWPPYRRLALLEAYAGKEGGVPASRLGGLLYSRASLLRQLGRYSEALPNATRASEIAKAESGEVSERFASHRQLEAILLIEIGQPLKAKTLLEAVLKTCEEQVWFSKLLVSSLKSVLGSALSALGYLQDARDLEEVVFSSREHLLGASHPETLQARSNLAQTLRGQGDLVRARAHQEAVLSLLDDLLGSSHLETLGARSNLAQTLRIQGDLVGARVHQEAVLSSLEAILGMSHPKTLILRNSLAQTMKGQGDLESARVLELSVVAEREAQFGASHPRTLKARSNLATTLAALGDHKGALELQESVLKSLERILEPFHQDMLQARNNIAVTLKALGGQERSRELQESVLVSCEDTLGKSHPYTLKSRNNLAQTLKEQGKLERALELQELTASLSEDLLGASHPSTLIARDNLAGVLRAQGNLEVARQVQESVVSSLEAILGSSHPSTLTAHLNLAGTLRAQGDLTGARELQELAIRSMGDVFGSSHPSTLTARLNLAETLRAQGDLAGARELQESVLTSREESLGQSHPNTLTARLNLAETLYGQRDFAGARDLLRMVIPDLVRVLGTEHPTTLKAKGNLVVVQVAISETEKT